MADFLVPLAVLTAIAFIVWRASKRSKIQSTIERFLQSGGLTPAARFEGRFYYSVRDADLGGGKYGDKFTLAIYPTEPLIRLCIVVGAKVTEHEIETRNIRNVRLEYTPILLVIVDIDAADFPLEQLFLYPLNRGLSLRDALRDACSRSDPR